MSFRAAGLLVTEILQGLWTGSRLLLRLRPDMLYVNTVTVPLWILLGWSFRLPVIAHVHEAESMVPAMVRTILYAPLNLATGIVANSRYSTEIMALTFPGLQSKTTILYNGVSGPKWTTPCRRDLGGTLRIVYIGRLSPRKGIDVLIDALGILHQEGIEASLEVVGAVVPGHEFYEEQLQRAIADKGLSEVVHFHGFDPDIWPHLERADVAVVPSRGDEPFGNTAVEALLAARPLVVSDTSGLREAASGYSSAVFVEPGNANKLAEALHQVSDNWHSMREAACENAASALARNSTDHYRTALASVINDSLSGPFTC
jgi:glycosyltransferase involved in cell wall biosynthesis